MSTKKTKESPAERYYSALLADVLLFVNTLRRANRRRPIRRLPTGLRPSAHQFLAHCIGVDVSEWGFWVREGEMDLSVLSRDILIETPVRSDSTFQILLSPRVLEFVRLAELVNSHCGQWYRFHQGLKDLQLTVKNGQLVQNLKATAAPARKKKPKRT